MAFSLKAHSTTDGWKDFLGGELLNLGLNGLNIVISYEDRPMIMLCMHQMCANWR
jgi:hypothetical protein